MGKDQKKYGADAIVQSLINHDVKFVFGIPGAKIDRLFDRLDHPTSQDAPKFVLVRHEQNASFIAGGIGRITGKPGVVATTSGPGASNLATGLATAFAEGDPILAISGQVQRADLSRLTHQSMKNAALFEPITKYSVEVEDANNLSEVVANAWQAASASKQGPAFISIPQDVTDSEVTSEEIHHLPEPQLGSITPAQAKDLAAKIKAAKCPVLLCGMRASAPEVTYAIRDLVAETSLPVVETFQAAGVISHELEDSFFGRIGLFKNQPGDILLQDSDLVITIGYDPIEYEARNWNVDNQARIIALDSCEVEISKDFQPEQIIIGDLAATISSLTPELKDFNISPEEEAKLVPLREEIQRRDDAPEITADQVLSHPLNLVQEIQKRVTDDMTVSVDIGSHYIWMARHFRSFEPRHLLFTNGMQTLGVALPWGIAAALVRPNAKSVSMSGDGGFLFSGQELETAVRLNLNLVHIIWNDGYYDMVKFQEELKYDRSAAVKFGPVDFAAYAESFGATGLRVEKAADLGKVLDQAFAIDGPVVVDVPVDYSHNKELYKKLLPGQLH